MTLISLVILPQKEIPTPPNIKLVEVVLFFSGRKKMILLDKWDCMI